MVFSSLIFVFYFLPLVLLLTYAVPPRLANFVLLFFSLLFYGWGEPVFLALMLFSILINYLFGLFVVGRAWALGLCVSINLGLLIYFKYAAFAVENFNKGLGFLEVLPFAVPSVVLPVGISFFTFQAMSYVIDVYRQEVPPQKKLSNVALYISFFPHLIAGPIVRYKDVNDQFELSRRVSWERFYWGLSRFIVGLGKKVLLANPMGAVADSVFALSTAEQTWAISWIGILAYTFQIYFDFSGYSDMAIGLGRMFGFEFLENFDGPYLSRSVREFWRRWHMSLSTWFRDYLYVPLGGNKVSKPRMYLNLMIVFVLCGLWHGASWNFLIWGVWHGSFLILERVVKLPSVLRPLGHLYTMLVVIVGWVFFRAVDLPSALQYLENMFSRGENPLLLGETLDKYNMFVMFMCAICIIPWKYALNLLPRRTPYEYAFPVLLFLVFGFCCLELVSGSYNPFIYFRF